LSKIQVVIATHNRPGLILNAVNSVLTQTYSNFKLVVSDNSSNNQTEKLLSKIIDSRFTYVKRLNSFSGIDHLNLILHEINEDYFMIFHDDDLMLPEMLEILFKKINESFDIIAVGSNAFLNKYGNEKSKLFFNTKNDKLISKPAELVEEYFRYRTYAPFPSYLYKKTVSDKLRLNPKNGGKYSDLSFLVDILGLGKILITSIPTMKYFIHSNQDTSSHSFVDKLKLIDYVTKKSNLTRKNNLIKKSRVDNIYLELKNKMLKSDIKFSIKGRFFLQTKLILKYSSLINFLKIYYLFFKVRVIK
jgi:glycosyltransferase involved in cell wall biosynthesis